MQDRKYILGLSSTTLLIAICAVCKFTIHLLTASNYGYFVDELYTIALSKHLAFGYVDLPPLVPAMVALNRALLGESLLANHIPPALAGAATLVFVCLITKEFGGKLFAIGLSALGFIIAPVWLILDSFFCYDSIDQLILAIFLFVLVRFVRTGNKRLWIALGLLAGIACMTKTTILYLGPGFVLALLISKYRKDLLTPWPWLGAGLFLVLISPYVLWNYFNNWPTLEYWAVYSSQKVYRYSIPEYFVNILLTMNPLLFPLLVLGLYRIFRRLGDTDYSFFGIMALVTLVLVDILHARSFMLAEVFMPLIAAGAVFVEEKLAGLGWEKRLKIAAVSYLVAGGILVLPSAVPLLPLELLPAYAQTFGFLYQPVKDFTYPKSAYPQEFSNRLGWEELVRTVADVYYALPADERANCGIYAEWYGPAGAIDLFGPKYGLPPAASGHLTYWLWGAQGRGNGECTLVVTQNVGQYLSAYEDVHVKAVILSNEYAMPYNKTLRVIECRKPKMPIAEAWPLLKFYY